MEKITTQEELYKVLQLVEQFHNESRYAHTPLATIKAIQILDKVQAHPEKFYIKYKQTIEGEVVGLFIGYIEQLFFSTTLQARDLVFYVREDHRGSPWFIRTLKNFESWAKGRGAQFIELAHNTGIGTENAPPMFQRSGYTQVGYIFNKEI